MLGYLVTLNSLGLEKSTSYSRHHAHPPRGFLECPLLVDPGYRPTDHLGFLACRLGEGLEDSARVFGDVLERKETLPG